MNCCRWLPRIDAASAGLGPPLSFIAPGLELAALRVWKVEGWVSDRLPVCIMLLGSFGRSDRLLHSYYVHSIGRPIRAFDRPVTRRACCVLWTHWGAIQL